MGKGVEVYVGATGEEVCPVQAVLTYATIRGTGQGSFFLLENSAPLTKPVFMAAVRDGLRQLEMIDSLHAGQSFRIGVATTQLSQAVRTNPSLGEMEQCSFPDLCMLGHHQPRLLQWPGDWLHAD